MARKWTRREVLQTSTSATIGTGLGGWGAFNSPHKAEAASRPLGHSDNARIERLAERIISSEPDRVVDIVVNELEKGLSRQQLLAANFVAGIRYQGHHYAYVAHPVNVVSNSIPVNKSLLPHFCHIATLKDRQGGARLQNLDKTHLPSVAKAEGIFHAAMVENNREEACRSFLALARGYGPQQAYNHLWMYGAERNHRSGGHTAISVVNTFRTLQAIGWRCSETVLQFAVEDTAVGKVTGSNLHVVNRERAARVSELPRLWATTKSDRRAVLELLALYRKGDSYQACNATFDMLRKGRIHAGTVWDAVFLTTAELVTRYTWVGSKMLAGHSITCANALHFMFRTVTDPTSRLYALLEAVEWTTSFLDRERARPALRDRSIIDISPAEITSNSQTLEHVFSTIPIRRRRQFSPVLLPEADKAQELAFAWAKRHKDHALFFQQALRLLCMKSTTEVHDFKFPLALFENYHYASPEWKPNLLAASVYVLHGTEMDDAPFVQQALDRLK